MTWVYITDKAIIFGRGRTVIATIDDRAKSRKFRAKAAAIYDNTAYFRQHSDRSEFIAALAAAIAARDIQPESAASFSNVQQLTSYFDGVDREQVIINLHNSIIASSLAVDGQPINNIAHTINQGFMDGQLLKWPEDKERLLTSAVLDQLPGIAYCFLGLDKGRPSSAPTFAREVRLEAEYQIRQGA